VTVFYVKVTVLYVLERRGSFKLEEVEKYFEQGDHVKVQP